MKKIISVCFIVLLSHLLLATEYEKPCKSVKIDMTQSEVIKLCGEPSEIDTLGKEKARKDEAGYFIVWQYGTPGEDNNQQVEFNDDAVTNVISNAKKYSELCVELKDKKVTIEEFTAKVSEMNSEFCK